jgi:hypothetical protein
MTGLATRVAGLNLRRESPITLLVRTRLRDRSLLSPAARLPDDVVTGEALSRSLDVNSTAHSPQPRKLFSP